MAVLSNAGWRVHPGRTADFMKAVADSKAVHERLGARPFLIQWSHGGASSGAMGYGLLFDDLAAWAKFADALPSDAGWRSVVAQHLNIPSPSAAPLSQTLATDLPGFEAPTPAAPGTFVFGANAQVAAGRLAADAIALMTDIKPLCLEMGAQWMRFRRVTVGGENSLALTTTLGFASAGAYAAWQAKFSADPRGQAFQQAVYGPSSPFGAISQAFGRVVPL